MTRSGCASKCSRRRDARASPAGFPDPDGPDGTGWALKLSVSAPPEDGKANAAVIALLARTLGVAKSAISVVSGATDRRKLVEIRGDEKNLRAALDALLLQPGKKD